MKHVWIRVKPHIAALLLACLFGSAMVFPFFFFQRQLGSAYHGIERRVADDEFFYLASIQDVLDGHPLVSNAYLKEFKQGFPQQMFLPEYLLALPLMVFPAPVAHARVPYTFLFCALAFFLTYGISLAISRSRRQSLAAGIVLFFGVFATEFWRPISPQFNFIFWLTAFWLLWTCVRQAFPKRLMIWTGLNIGLLFYLYPYYWTYFVILSGLLAVLLFFFRRALAVRVGLMLVGAAFVGSYYFYYTLQASHQPGYQDTLLRIGTLYSHTPGSFLLAGMGIVWLAIWGILTWKKRLPWNEESAFFLSAVCAFVIASNQQIVTGTSFQFSSHYLMVSVFASVFGVLYLMRAMKPFPAPAMSGLWGILAVGVLAAVVMGQRGYWRQATSISDQDRHAQAYATTLAWLNAHSPKDAVVYADESFSDYVPVYTHDNVVFAFPMSTFILTDQEYQDRFWAVHYFDAVTSTFVADHQRTLFGVRYINAHDHAQQINRFLKFLGRPLMVADALPASAVEQAVHRATEMQKKPLTRFLDDDHVDYIVVDRDHDTAWNIDPLTSFQKAFEDGPMIVYRRVPQP